jgi:hypothetical protein
MISGITKQWILFFLTLKRSGWFRKNLPCDKAVLTFIFIPILQDEIRDWVEDYNAALIWP